MSPGILIGLTVALLLSWVAPATAGVVRGTLWMNRAATAAARTLTSPEAIAKRQRGVTDAVIYLEKIPAGLEQRLSGRGWSLFPTRPKRTRPVRIVQNQRRFTPRVLSIPAGTRVEFLNLDRVYHNAFSVSSARRFDLGKYPPGGADTVQFDRPGVINLHCDIHPDMLGYIVVTPNHAYARCDSLGVFRLPKLPAGSYRLRAWHPDRGEIVRAIDMPRRGDVTLELKF